MLKIYIDGDGGIRSSNSRRTIIITQHVMHTIYRQSSRPITFSGDNVIISFSFTFTLRRIQ